MENLILHQTPITELKIFISEAIREELNKLIQPQAPEPEPTPEWLTRKEVSERLNITLVTLDKYTRAGILQGYRIGGRIKYKTNDIGKAYQEMKNAKYKRG